MPKESKYTSIHYNSYLQLEKILDAQDLRSEAVDKPAHEEMLFIITHQVYELWFKQINHELRSIIKMFNQDDVNEKSIGTAVHRIDRIEVIMKLLIEQISVMETMTPLDFLDFRAYLFPASGFQSFQFREMEVMLGLKEEHRHTYHNTPYKAVFDEKKKKTLSSLEKGKSLLELVNEWLERTPFLELGSFNFMEYYMKAVRDMLDKEKRAIEGTNLLTEKYKKMRLAMVGDSDSYFASIMDEEKHNEMMENGEVRLSYRATVAALFINLYRDQPILQMPYRLLANLTDLDDLVTTWRYRHAQMVMRMLGRKVGTGGSSGHEYLAKTAASHHIFKDLHNVSTLLIPRSELPALPDELKTNLAFYFSVHKS